MLNSIQLENWKNNSFLRWLYKCHDDKRKDIVWLCTELMSFLDPEGATCIQDQIDNAKTLEELMNILMVTVMNNYPLVAMRMWALQEEAAEGIHMSLKQQQTFLLLIHPANSQSKHRNYAKIRNF